MSKPMVPRVTATSGTGVAVMFVTASDAAKLEAVVEAAKEMRSDVRCYYYGNYDAPYTSCACRNCNHARAYDAAMAEVKP